MPSGSGRAQSGYSEVCMGANYSADEIEFMLAVEQYRRDTRRRFPSCSEILAAARALGYRKLPSPPTENVDEKAV